MPWIAKVNSLNVTDAKSKDTRKVGDVVAFYNTLPKAFSERELKYLDIIEISEEEAVEYKKAKNRVKQFFKAASTGWTDKFPETKDGWQDEKGNVYELKESPFQIVNHDKEKGFILNAGEIEKNKETVLIAAKIIGEITK